MDQKPIFIPLKAEFFEAFERGHKEWEFRPYGDRWNERTCQVGRPVVLSYGYGKKRRLHGVVAQFVRSPDPTKTEAWRKCYGDREGDAACIRVELMSNYKWTAQSMNILDSRHLSWKTRRQESLVRQRPPRACANIQRTYQAHRPGRMPA